MAAFSSNIDITSGGTYAMDVTNGETSSKVATDLNGKFANIQELLRNGLPEVWTGSSLPDSLPNGKIINYRNTLYYGANKTQVATNNQISNLQSQITSISSGGKFSFFTYTGSKTYKMNFNLNENTSDYIINVPLIDNISQYKMLYCTICASKIAITNIGSNTINDISFYWVLHSTSGISYSPLIFEKFLNNMNANKSISDSSPKNDFVIFNDMNNVYLVKNTRMDVLSSVITPVSFDIGAHYLDYGSMSGNINVTITYTASMLLDIT